MENRNAVIRMYYQQVSPRDILTERIDYRHFEQKDFEALSRTNLRHLSETDTRELYDYLGEEGDASDGETGLHVFRALKKTASDYLLVRENLPVCRYDRLLQWRELTRWIGEDLPVCAFLADRTEKGQRQWDDFEWNTVVGHDNMQLNRLMQRGISDNHFHLFGSAPSFKLIWIRFMNHLLEKRYSDALEEMDTDRRVTRNAYKITYQEDSLVRMRLQAALIRAVLFYFIFQEKTGVSRKENTIVQREKEIRDFLTGEFPFVRYRGRIQSFIDKIRLIERLRQEGTTDDYANWNYDAKGIHHDFEGERGLMYQMLLGTVNGKEIPPFLLQWFYAYLTIQIRIREELVQVNNTIGFENFSNYNDRKSRILFTEEDRKKMVQHAVCGSLEGGNLQSLELRITPQKTARENSRQIEMYDNCISAELGEQAIRMTYYVYHFPKKQDENLARTAGFTVQCRHDSYRAELEKTADELAAFRERESKTAARVLGIDACAQEIGCRPEVFAPVFRKLTNHVVERPRFGDVRQWKMTYHVGEDFRDVADGLRALDEALLFLNMRNGDRLGHATVLGIDVKKWYQKKKNSIYLPKQDYLDNVVWLFHKLTEFNILESENLKGFLSGEYEKYFKEIYPPEAFGECGIDTYYEGWKLRGDHPYLYRTGRFDDSHPFFRQHWRNDGLAGGDKIRNRIENARLMYYYHYSAEVRRAGGRSDIKAVPELYVEGVEKVQRAMQKALAERGISMEANPSSNFMISTMEHYHEHPIVKLFNMGLTVDEKEIRNCAQLHVSINTDDKGVFHTTLENEYALMGCALENMKDEQGRKQYQKQMVYEWLDHVRENGNQQSFLQSAEAERKASDGLCVITNN
ncbi:MAG: hypothetical protein NC254_04500 [bacterium]|nr:hypothetical protein [bacterium]